MTERQFMGQIVELARVCGWLVYQPHDPIAAHMLGADMTVFLAKR